MNWMNLFLLVMSSICFVRAGNLCSQVHTLEGSMGVIQTVDIVKNSLGYSGLDSVEAYLTNGVKPNKSSTTCGLKIAKMLNHAGKEVVASSESTNSAVRSRVSDLLYRSLCPGFGLCADISDGSDDDVWPIVAMTYIVIPLSNSDEQHDCSRVAATQAYVLWILQSMEAASIARSLLWAVMPEVIGRQAALLVSNMTCVRNGKDLLVENLTTEPGISIKGSGSTMQAGLQQALSNEFFYKTMISVTYLATGSGQGKADLLSGFVNFAASESLVDPADPVVMGRRLHMIPVFAGPVVFIFNVPEIQELVLSRQLANSILLGKVFSWADSRIHYENDKRPGFNPPNEAIIRIVRRDSSGTTETITKALYLFQDFPRGGNYSLHVLQGSSDPAWPAVSDSISSGVSCVYSNCSIQEKCSGMQLEIGRLCIATQSFFAFVGSLFVILLVTVLWIAHKFYHKDRLKYHSSAQSVFFIKESELVFENPRVLLGCGKFGEVYHAEYRGTAVAVKFVQIKSPQQQLIYAQSSNYQRSPKKHFFWRSPKIAGLPEEQSDHSVRSFKSFVRLVSNPSKLVLCSEGRQSLSTRDLGQLEDSNEQTARKTPIPVYQKKKSHEVTLTEAYLARNITTLGITRHPCICAIMGVILQPQPALILEFMELGSLYDVLRNQTISLDAFELYTITADVGQGMRYLHGADDPIVHGDLKSSNVLIDSFLRAKVADFGLSRLQGTSKGISSISLAYLSIHGASLAHIAPEILRRENGPSKETDVYAFGILVAEVIGRRNPYLCEDLDLILDEVKNKDINLRPPIPENCGHYLANLMQECWHPEPALRPSFENIYERLKMLAPEQVVKESCTGSSPINTDSSRGNPSRNSSTWITKLHRNRNASCVLRSMFPENVADALIRGDKVQPVNMELVSVYFSDIVGFTEMSSRMSAAKVSWMLDRLYTCFDALAEKYSTYKIDTIGDAYLAATNLITDQSDLHASLLARFAVEAVRVASCTLIDEDDPSKGYIRIRVGIASGPATASVVGTRNPKFTLFGDTINTASRMESHSLPGCIQCSEFTAQCIKVQDAGVCVKPRGQIIMKSKGKVFTHWITGFESFVLPEPPLEWEAPSSSVTFQVTLQPELANSESPGPLLDRSTVSPKNTLVPCLPTDAVIWPSSDCPPSSVAASNDGVAGIDFSVNKDSSCDEPLASAALSRQASRVLPPLKPFRCVDSAPLGHNSIQEAGNPPIASTWE